MWKSLQPTMIYRLLILLCGLGIGTQTVQAQGGEPRRVAGLKSGLRVTCLGDWKGEELFIKDSKKGSHNGMRKVDILDRGYSPMMEYKQKEPIQFFLKTDEEKKPYALALSVKVPEGVLQPLVLLVSEDGKMLYKVFDIDPKKFPFGSCKIVNFSKKTISILMNKDGKRLKPGEQCLYPAPKEQQERAAFQMADLDKKKLIFSTMMIRRAHKRIIIFLVNDTEKGEGRIKPRVLVDFKPAPKKRS